MTSNISNPSFLHATAAAIYRNRRRLATGSAMAIAAVLGYFAVAGDNGIAVYKQKRMEDRQLTAKIEQLKQENGSLQNHVERLKSDPHAIEQKAREILHYTQPGEVIYTLPDTPANASKSNPPSTSANSSSASSQ
jgi:cell division protein FtsB